MRGDTNRVTGKRREKESEREGEGAREERRKEIAVVLGRVTS